MKAKKLKLSAIVVSLSLSTLLGACGGAANQAVPTTPDAPSGNQASSPADTSKATKGGIVRTTLSSEPDNLNPHLSAAADTAYVMNNIFEGLIGFNAQGEFIPRLASEYTISEDGLTYTFVIREDVVFHNGKALTLDDVIYSYEELAGLNGKEPLSSLFSHVVGLNKVDDKTLNFVLDQKDASFLSACTLDVIPNDYLEQSTKPVGTGPFKFKEYIPGEKIVLEANTDYYNKDRLPFIDGIEFKIMTDPSSILMALKAKELDIAQVDSVNAASLEGEFKVISHPQNMVQIFALNNHVAPFDNLKVRQAINYAIDKDIIISGVVNGYGTKLYTNSSPVMGVWYKDLSASEPYPYDLEKAKALLSEAGYPNGFTTTVKVPSNYLTHVDTAQVIKEQLAAIGITLNIELIEWGQWLDKVYATRDFESTIIAFAGKLEPHEVFERFESSFKRNFSNFSNSDYDAIIAKASQETDQTKRIALYGDAQDILAKDVASVFIMDPHLILASVPTLQGYTPYSVPYFDASLLYYTSR